MSEKQNSSEAEILQALICKHEKALDRVTAVIDRMTLDAVKVVPPEKYLEMFSAVNVVMQHGLKLINKSINTWKNNPFGDVGSCSWKRRARYATYEFEVYRVHDNVVWQITNIDGGHVSRNTRLWKTSECTYSGSFNAVGRLISLAKIVPS